jgi:ATP-dependent Clp protease ATP-binding subunit ClpC
MEQVSRRAKAILYEIKNTNSTTIKSVITAVKSTLARVEKVSTDMETILEDISKEGGNKKVSTNVLLETASMLSRSRMAEQIESVDIVCALAKISGHESKTLYKYILSETGDHVAAKVEASGNMCVEALEEPIIGRVDEITQLAACVVRRNKVPFVIGKPGVGKTSVVRGLARLLAFNAIPQLNGVILLDTRYYLPTPMEVPQGQLQMIRPGGIGDVDTHMALVQSGLADRTKVIGIFDGAGRSHAQQINTMAKIGRVIVTCDDDDYKGIIEGSKYLQKKAVVVRVSEPSNEETKKILRLKAKKFEYSFNCKIPADVLDYAVDVSTKFHCEDSQPTRSITLLEITCARKRVKLSKDARFLETDIEKEIRDGNIDKLRQMVEASGNEQMAKALLAGDMVSVTKEEVSQTLRLVAEISPNIPMDAITADSVKQLQMLEPYVSKKVYGQEDAIKAVCNAIKRKSLGLSEPQKPASFLFVGPTGVGKTYLAQNIAELLFGSEKSILKFDMSEYMERHSVSKLIGAPPGYIGFEKGGRLTNKVYNRPHCVLLLDEIEKAHPDILNALLQVLEDGRLTDSRDREVSFKHAIIIMTSNLGTKTSIKYGMGFSRDKDETAKEKVLDDVKKFMSPEFINRLNMIVHFNALNDESLKKILKYNLEHIADFSSYKVDIEENVIDLIMKRAKDNPKVDLYGAREIKRMVQTQVADTIAEKIITSGLSAGSTVILKAKGDKLIAERKKDGK